MKNLPSSDIGAPANGAQSAIRTLESLGVELCFSYPGAAAVEFHQALADSAIRVVLPRHEQGGAFAACGYARATGKVGVCMATSGPGATNLVTGIADAFMDSVPMVIFTGQVDLNHIGTNAFQEVDIIGMTRPVVKHSFLITDVNEIDSTIREAFALARSGRPGPVLIDFPKDIQKQFPQPEKSAEMRPVRPAPGKLAPEAVRRLSELIHRAERPCIYAGGGVIAGDASAELLRFGGNDAELYFETEDFDGFLDTLEGVRLVAPVIEHRWGQRVVRLYDPDDHIIEVGEPLQVVCRRFLESGLTQEGIARRMDVPLELVEKWLPDREG